MIFTELPIKLPHVNIKNLKKVIIFFLITKYVLKYLKYISKYTLKTIFRIKYSKHLCTYIIYIYVFKKKISHENEGPRKNLIIFSTVQKYVTFWKRTRREKQ